MKRSGAMRGAAGIALATVFGTAVAATAGAAEDAGAVTTPVPAEVRTYALGGGRFEVVAAPGDEGLRLARLAEGAWDAWREPLALPERLPIGITVRLAAADQWGFPEPSWRVAGDPGGIVTVWIRAGGAADLAQERRWLMALAEGALHRQAMFLGANPDRLVVPHWVVTGAAEAALARTNSALLDAWQQAALRAGRMPPLRATLAWTGAQTSPEADPRRVGAFGAWQWLQMESGRTTAWRRFMAALLEGTAPGAALVNAYPERLGRADAAEIELAWQVGAAWLARARTTPLMDAEESGRILAEADRIVVEEAAGGAEQALRLSELWLARADAFVAAERETRILWLTANFPRVHPFYRNAAGSLGRVLVALRDGDASGWSAALTDWRHDLATGQELEQASKRLLDAVGR